MKAEVRQGRLLLSDLRMGQHPYYVFTHAVAEGGDPHWRAIPGELITPDIDGRAVIESLQRILTP